MIDLSLCGRNFGIGRQQAGGDGHGRVDAALDGVDGLALGGVGDDIIRPGSPSQAINGGPDEVIGDDGYTNTGFVDADVLRGYITSHSPLKAADFAPGDAVVRK